MPLQIPRLKRIIRKILDLEGVREARLSLVFVTDRQIQALNKKFLHRSYSTDVLAFDLADEVLSRKRKKNVKIIEGEVIISATTVYNNARRFGNSPEEELILCVVHGILHLLGYDDHAPADIKRMRAKEKELMEKIR